MKQFKKLVDTMSVEHLESKYSITCEFSTSSSDLTDKRDYLKNKKLNDGFHWELNECETCVEHDKTTPYHVEIINEEFQ